MSSNTQVAVDAVSNVVSQPMKYLDKALGTIRNLGVLVEKEDQAPVLALVSQLEALDPDNVAALARVLQQSSMFNALVRDHIGAMTLSDRYNKIADDFTSIRTDSQRMLDDLSDGDGYSLREKIHQIWMKLRRGSVPARYQRIRTTYLDVSEDSRVQIDRERAILEAYKDYRLALKQGEVVAYSLLENAEGLLKGTKAGVDAANGELKALTESEGSQGAIAQAEMARDEALRKHQDTDRLYQVAKDLAENIKVAYATGEVVMARLQQTTDVKERVYKRAVVFFSTNETVFTGLNAAMTSMHGLNESTQTLNALEDGMNQGIEQLADIGDGVLKEGVRAGYGPGLKAESVGKLVDAVVNFQSEMFQLSSEMRAESTKNAADVAAIVEDGKQRFVQLVSESH